MCGGGQASLTLEGVDMPTLLTLLQGVLVLFLLLTRGVRGRRGASGHCLRSLGHAVPCRAGWLLVKDLSPLAECKLDLSLPVVTRTKVYELRGVKPQSSSLLVLKTESQLEMRVSWAGLL